MTDMPNMRPNTPSVAIADHGLKPFVCLKVPYIIFREHKGFTLIELMVTMAVAAALMIFAVPSFKSFMQNTRLATQTNSLISDIAVSRNTATTRPARVVICTSSNGATCTGSGWSSGRLMYWEVSPFGGGPTTTNIIRYTEALPTSVQSFAPTSIPDPLRFDSFGRPVDAFGAPLSATVAMPVIVTFCDVDKKVPGRQVTISASGSANTNSYVCP